LNKYSSQLSVYYEFFPIECNIDLFIITVGTPLLHNSNIPNFSYLLNSIEVIKPNYHGQLVVLRSTVSVGISRGIVFEKLASIVGKENVKLAFCPERTVEGKALHELNTLPQIIGGLNEKSIGLAKHLFKGTNILVVDSLEEAELIKLFNNIYRDVTFSIGNYLNEVAQYYGIDGINLINKANHNYNRSNIPKPGFVGGPCLEKDSYILSSNLNDVSRNFILESREFNKGLEDKIIYWLLNKCKINREVNILISGLAFKGVPETSDMRGSNSLNLVLKLKEMGFNISVHDFAVKDTDLLFETGCNVISNNDFISGKYKADFLLILNNNVRYSKVHFSNKNSLVIFDLWDSILKDHVTDKFVKIYTIGNYKT
jgi:UDP-N-acetyl-D-mannosaminuronic acid dehydrogenase